MRLGIIADTHGKLAPGVVEAFAGVDHILHGGDIGSTDVLAELGALAEVTAVYGNTDGWDVRGQCKQTEQLELEGFIIVVTHGDQFGSPNPTVLHQAFPDAEVIVYGHTHKPCMELVDKTVTVMNPGSAGAPRFGIPPSVGIMELEPGIPPRGRIVPL